MKHWICIVYAAAAAGCHNAVSPISPTRLSGTWALEAFELSGGQLIPVTDTGAYTLEIVDETRLSVRADCNVCSGSYALTETALDLGPLACTLAACPEGSFDASYLRALDTASRYEVNGTTLRLVYDVGVLRFARTATP